MLSEIGEGKTSGGSLAPINWIDIKAWIDVTGSQITAGEAEALRTMSSVYVNQFYDSMDKACPSPNIERPKDREVVAGKIKSLFAMLRN